MPGAIKTSMLFPLLHHACATVRPTVLGAGMGALAAASGLYQVRGHGPARNSMLRIRTPIKAHQDSQYTWRASPPDVTQQRPPNSRLGIR